LQRLKKIWQKKREEGSSLAEKQAKLETLKKQQGYAIGSAVGTGLMLTGMGLGLAS
jgi:putative heme iron utilization protein